MKEFQLKYKCDIQEEHCTQYYALAMLEKLESAVDNSFFDICLSDVLFLMG